MDAITIPRKAADRVLKLRHVNRKEACRFLAGGPGHALIEINEGSTKMSGEEFHTVGAPYGRSIRNPSGFSRVLDDGEGSRGMSLSSQKQGGTQQGITNANLLMLASAKVTKPPHAR